MKHYQFLPVFCLFTAPFLIQAQTVTAVTGTTQTTSGLNGFTTFGDDLTGVEVTANFLGGASETFSFVSGGPGFGQADNTGGTLSIFVDGDTFSPSFGNWEISIDGLQVTSLVFDGAPGDVVWDRSAPDPGTPGSGSGLDFLVEAADASVSGTVITYSDEVQIGASPALQDI